jgi:hypothetical protein
VGIVGVVALLMAAVLVDYYKEAERAHHAAHQQYEESKRVKPLGAAGSDRPYTDPKAYRDEWRAERDLEAQWSMAQWTRVGAIATVIGIIILAATFWETTRTARVASKAAESAAKQAAAAFEAVAIQRRENRAWLRIEDVQPDGDHPLIIIDSGAATLAVVIKVRNIGRTIASRVRVLARPAIIVGTGPRLHETIASLRERTQTRGPGKLILFPDEPAEFKELLTIKRSDIDAALALREKDDAVRSALRHC